jgi:hypothetical protein
VRRILTAGLLVGTLLATGAWGYSEPSVADHRRVDAEYAQARRERAWQYSFRARGYNHGYGYASPSPRPGQLPMTSAIFTPLLNKVATTWNPQEKLYIVQVLATKPYDLTVAQVAELTQFFFSEGMKVRVIELLAPHICDPQNFGQLEAMVYSYGARNRVAELFVRPAAF